MADERALILSVNPGSTSTKLGVFDGAQALFEATLVHGDAELAEYTGRPVLDQLEMRLARVLAELERREVEVARLRAVAGRGGLLRPLASGTYRVTAPMLADLRETKRGEHASNLGAFLAHELAALADVPAYVVDPVSVDEWEPAARLSGLAGLDRECLSHALNTKAVAKRFAREQGRPYESLRLLVAHLGGGISVSAHRGGRMVDVTNSREEGPFSVERAGGLPVMKLVELCFSGKLSRQELEQRIFGSGGVFSYLGTRDLREALERAAAGDAQARLVLEAMLYQIARELGGFAAAALGGVVDAILVTGGMARARAVVTGLEALVGWIAPLHVYPGEDELLALAEGALRVLDGEEEPLDY